MKISGSASRRESQILDIVYERGRVTAVELQDMLPRSPSNSAVRWHLRALEAKGLLTHVEEKGAYLYLPTSPREAVAKGELSRLLSSFFGGSVVSVMTALLDQERDRLTDSEIADLRRLIEEREAEARK